MDFGSRSGAGQQTGRNHSNRQKRESKSGSLYLHSTSSSNDVRSESVNFWGTHRITGILHSALSSRNFFLFKTLTAFHGCGSLIRKNSHKEKSRSKTAVGSVHFG